MRTANKKIAAVALGAVALTGTGVAYAYWTTTGDGTGTAAATAGNGTAFSVTGNVPSAMFPGDTAQTITATVTNTGTDNYRVATLKAYVTTDKAGCTGGDFLINGTAAPSVPASAVSLAIEPVDLEPAAAQTKDYTIQFNNRTDVPQDDCKGAEVEVHYLAS